MSWCTFKKRNWDSFLMYHLKDVTGLFPASWSVMSYMLILKSVILNANNVYIFLILYCCYCLIIIVLVYACGYCFNDTLVIFIYTLILEFLQFTHILSVCICNRNSLLQYDRLVLSLKYSNGLYITLNYLGACISVFFFFCFRCCFYWIGLSELELNLKKWKWHTTVVPFTRKIYSY